METYVIVMPNGKYFGHDRVTGNLTLNGDADEAKTYNDRYRAEMDARFMVGAYVELQGRMVLL